MVDQNEAYTFQKRGIFYFSKRVPSDLREFYEVSRLTYSLKTKCPKLAKTKVRDAIHKLSLSYRDCLKMMERLERMNWQRKIEKIRNGLIEILCGFIQNKEPFCLSFNLLI